jgi:hypothetical protein
VVLNMPLASDRFSDLSSFQVESRQQQPSCFHTSASLSVAI